MNRVLKPCPFCGGDAHVMEDERFKQQNHGFPKWAVICFGCGVRTPIVDMTTAVKIWNRREEKETDGM